MAADTIARQTLSYRDAKGMVARTSVFIHYDSAAPGNAATVGSNVSGALSALTNAATNGTSGPYSIVVVPTYGATATYVDVEDKALLTLKCADGTLHKLAIPSPKSALFLADGQTVDAANAGVVTLITNLTTATVAATAGNRSGSPFTGLIGGQRTRRKTQRKMTIWTKSGSLLEPAE